MNITLVDKSEFQVKYMWDKHIDLFSRISEVVCKYKIINHKSDAIICYLDSVEYENFRNNLPREFVIHSISFNTLPKELSPMCRRWIQYGGIYFMETPHG